MEPLPVPFLFGCFNFNSFVPPLKNGEALYE